MKFSASVFLVVLLFISVSFAQDEQESHNCRFMGIISEDMPDSLIQDYYINYLYSLEQLSETSNIDGWGIASYQTFGSTATINRGAIRAINDPEFDVVIEGLERAGPDIIIGHVRNCSAGCCAHGSDSIPDPHPFVRYKNDRTWTFVHNGTADKALLYSLVGEEYLEENPLTGSGIPECDPADSDLVIDSELYFLLLLKNIEQQDWNVTEGIIEALRQINIVSWDEALNFILSDGTTLWTYRLDRTLYYYVDPNYEFTAIASRYPTRYIGNWITVAENQLLVANAGQAPEIYDLCSYLPYITGTITDPTGEPISYTYITTIDAPFSARSDANGDYRVRCLSQGSYNIRYRHAFYADTIIQGIEVLPTDIDVVQDLVLRYPGRLTGRVTDNFMTPLPEIKVVVYGTSHRTYTDEDGYYSLDSLDLGDSDIKFIDEYYDDTTVTDITIYTGRITTLNLVMRPCAYITGVLTDSTGMGLENIIVELYPDSRTDTSDFYGTFSFDSLNSGVYDLTFYHTNYADTSLEDIETISGDTTDIDMQLRFLGYMYLLGDANMYHNLWPPKRIGNDVTYIVNYLRGIPECAPCLIEGIWGSADVTGDCNVFGNDVTRLVIYFRGLGDLYHCPNIQPRWINSSDIPEDAPDDWPPCENYPDLNLLHQYKD